MKATLLIAASLLGTAAIAQTTPDDSAPASTASTASPDAAATAPSNAPTAAPMTAPDTNDAASGMATNAQAVTTDTSNYPACSRTVTDKCVQRGAGHKSRPHR